MIELKKPTIISVQSQCDVRGMMGILEEPALPFKIRRIFWLSQVPDETRRGGHAHYRSEQLLVCTSGSIKIVLEDLNSTFYRFHLDASNQGLFLPPLHWGIYKFEDQAQAFCLASDCFDEQDYIRDYQKFQQLKGVYQVH